MYIAADILHLIILIWINEYNSLYRPAGIKDSSLFDSLRYIVDTSARGLRKPRLAFGGRGFILYRPPRERISGPFEDILASSTTSALTFGN